MSIYTLTPVGITILFVYSISLLRRIFAVKSGSVEAFLIASSKSAKLRTSAVTVRFCPKTIGLDIIINRNVRINVLIFIIKNLND